MAIKSRTEECMTNSLYISTQKDFSERYQPAPNGEIMSEGFAKDQSLSMEGVCLSLKPCNGSERKKYFILIYQMTKNKIIQLWLHT